MDRWENVRVILPAIYGIPSMLASTLIVTVICARLKAPFYRMFAFAQVTVGALLILLYKEK